MVAVAYAEETAKAHDRVVRFPGALVDHHVIDAAELLAGGVVHGAAIDFTRGNKAIASIRRIINSGTSDNPPENFASSMAGKCGYNAARRLTVLIFQ